MADELKSCPLCGSTRITVWNIRDGQQVVCKDCKALGAPTYHGPAGFEATRGHAIAAWNRRPSPSVGQDVDGLVERLTRERDELTAALEQTALKFFAAQTELEQARKALEACDWYWPEDDTSSDACSNNPWDIIQDGKRGSVFAISRGGVVETRYYARLPPADDSDSDDDFDVDEATEAEAVAKIEAERARRIAALAQEGGKS